MKIAVSSQNFRTVTAHAGKARRFIVFDLATPGQQIIKGCISHGQASMQTARAPRSP